MSGEFDDGPSRFDVRMHRAQRLEAEVAEATFAAATDNAARIRYPAGPDSQLLAELRWTTSEPHYLGRMRAMFAP
jgi:hypothetical protein